MRDIKKLSFNSAGGFTILQITDLHAVEDPAPEDEISLRRAVETTRPDLIVMTGDNISGYACKTKENSKRAIKNYMDLLNLFGIPVAIVFGNHDDDRTPYSKAEQIAQYETYDCFIGRAGLTAERTIAGKHTVHTGNYNLPIYESAESDRILFNIWCFDSGSEHADPAVDSYGYVFQEQIDWYVRKAETLRAANGGVSVPSFVFQHIAPPHIVHALKPAAPETPGAVHFADGYYTLPDDADPTKNWLREAPCPPNTNLPEGYAQVDAMIKQGDVQAIFFGHDHINCFTLRYAGIDFVCSPGCGFHSYNDEHKGFRVITLNRNRLPAYETFTIRTADLLQPNT